MYVHLICGNNLPSKSRLRIKSTEKAIYLSADETFGNVSFKPEAVATALGTALDPISLDLCEIASYVYMGDKAVSRGKHEKWTRNLSWIVPVREPERWNAMKEVLMNTIATLSGDNVRFTFVPKTVEKSKPKLKSRRKVEQTNSVSLSFPSVPDSDCSCLFSGGLDSFAGAAYLIQQGRRPVFASHYAGGQLKKKQAELLNFIQKRFETNFHHFQYRVSSRPNKRAAHSFEHKESSHRARSFLFMSFATVAAVARGLSEIFICENGVLSLNVPISDARKGSRSTRHAHPLYLYNFNRLIDAVYERKFDVHNPFFFQTKGEEIRLLRTLGLDSVIKDTVTCWGYPNQMCAYKYTNHCGYCIPCIVRRVSLIAAGMQNNDDQYLIDVFGPRELLTEKQLRNVEDLAYFCQSFSRLSKTELLYRYPELVMIESGNGSASDGKLDMIIRVYRKFAEEFLYVVRHLGSDLIIDSTENSKEQVVPSSILVGEELRGHSLEF